MSDIEGNGNGSSITEAQVHTHNGKEKENKATHKRVQKKLKYTKKKQRMDRIRRAYTKREKKSSQLNMVKNSRDDEHFSYKIYVQREYANAMQLKQKQTKNCSVLFCSELSSHRTLQHRRCNAQTCINTRFFFLYLPVLLASSFVQ